MRTITVSDSRANLDAQATICIQAPLPMCCADNFFRSRLPNYEQDMDPLLERILIFYEVGAGPLWLW